MRVGQVLVRRDGPSGAMREAEVVEVLGVNAGPPFLVRWLDSGRTSVLYPDSDVWLEPRTPPIVPEQPGNRCG
jgi:hypothetical protein